jgi:hypothetical protein
MRTKLSLIRGIHRTAMAVSIASIFVSGCANTTRITPAASLKNPGRGGVFFALPKTTIQAVVPVVRRSVTKAPYGEYAQLLLGQAPNEPGISVEIGKGVELRSVGVRDDRQIYFAEFGGGAFTNNELTIDVNSDGVLTQGISEQENKTADFVVSTIEVAGKVGGTIAKGFALQGGGEAANLQLRAAEIYGKRQKLTHEQRAQFMKAVELGISVRKLPPGDQAARIAAFSDDESAKWRRWVPFEEELDRLLAMAKRIQNLQDRRSSLLGDAGSTVEARKAALDQIEGELAEAQEPLLGKIVKTTWPGRFTIEPDDNTDSLAGPKPERKALIGLVKKGAAAGVIIWNNDFTPPIPSIFLTKSRRSETSVSVVIAGRKPREANSVAKVNAAGGRRGFRYRVPGDARVSLLVDGVARESIDTKVAQYGMIASLPASTGSAKTRWDLTLDPATGAVDKVALSNKAFDPALVNRAGNAADGFLGAVAERNQRDTELASVQRQHSILKMKSEMAGFRKTIEAEED